MNNDEERAEAFRELERKERKEWEQVQRGEIDCPICGVPGSRGLHDPRCPGADDQPDDDPHAHDGCPECISDGIGSSRPL